MSEIVSLAPNVTDIIVELGLSDQIVACTSYCEFEECEDIGGWLSPDYNRLRQIEPDLVFTSDPLQEEISGQVRSMGYETIHTNPSRFSDLTGLIETVGEEIGADGASEELINDVVRRYHKVKDIGTDENASVYCEEWDTPPMAAGNWVPDMIRATGKEYPFVESGERSSTVTENQFQDVEPEYFISHLCGQGKMTEFRSVRNSWDYDGDVYFVDDKYMNRLSTKTVTGLEIISEIVGDGNFNHSDKYSKISYEEATRSR